MKIDPNSSILCFSCRAYLEEGVQVDEVHHLLDGELRDDLCAQQLKLLA
jgi:hypothetical protein